MADEIRAEKTAVSAERLTHLTVAAYVRRVAVSELRVLVKEICEDLDFETKTSSEIIARLLENPELSSALFSCTDQDSIMRVVGEQAGFINRQIEAFQKEASSVRPDFSETDTVAVRQWISEGRDLVGAEYEAVRSAMDTLSKRWGAELGSDLSYLPDAKTVKGTVLAMVLAKGEKLTPEDLKQSVLSAGAEALAKKRLLEVIENNCSVADVENVTPEKVLAAMEKLHPQVIKDLLACRDKAEFEEVRLLDFSPRFDSCLKALVGNSSLAAALSKNDITALANERREAFQQGITKAIDALRGQFGAELVPENATLGSLLTGTSRNAVTERVLAEQSEVTPNMLAGFITTKFSEQVKLSILESRVAAICRQAGGDSSNAAAIRDLMLKNTRFAGELFKLESKTAIDEYLTAQDKFIRWEVDSSLRSESGKAGNLNEELNAAIQSGALLPTKYQIVFDEVLQSVGQKYGMELLADERSVQAREFKLAMQTALASRTEDIPDYAFSDIVNNQALKALNTAVLESTVQAFLKENSSIVLSPEEFRNRVTRQNSGLWNSTSAAQARQIVEEAAQNVVKFARQAAKREAVAVAFEKGDLSGLDGKLTDEISALVSTWPTAFPSAGIEPGTKLTDIFSARQMAVVARLIRTDSNYDPATKNGIAKAVQFAFFAKVVMAPLKNYIQEVAESFSVPVTQDAENKIIYDFLNYHRLMPSIIPDKEDGIETHVELYAKIKKAALTYVAPQVQGEGVQEAIDLFASIE